VASVVAEYLDAAVNPGARHGAHGGVHAGGVAAAGEDGDAPNRHIRSHSCASFLVRRIGELLR
jgi:hypothetical protein